MYRLRVPHAVGLMFCILSCCLQASPSSFESAKRIGMALFANHQQTLYCQCRFDNQKNVDLGSCGMSSASGINRALRIEWEHMMPASVFGSQFACWTQKPCVNNKTGKAYGGRKCCRKIDPAFRQAEGELYNLWPAVGLVNQFRSNYTYGTLPGMGHLYGCAFKVDQNQKRVEPHDKVKGLVARANLFMALRYQVYLDANLRNQMELWNAMYPPDAVEIQWAQKVALEEGYINPYILPN